MNFSVYNLLPLFPISPIIYSSRNPLFCNVKSLQCGRHSQQSALQLLLDIILGNSEDQPRSFHSRLLHYKRQLDERHHWLASCLWVRHGTLSSTLCFLGLGL